jgi:pimeloyl-ACP methyl ester carboxylesterase
MPSARINGHDMYYEVHGRGDPLLVLGGWGSYCHGKERHLARGLTERYSVLIVDYRGIGESGDDVNIPPSIDLHAQDVTELIDHLGYRRVHLVGLVGMGACICQAIAAARPDLARSLVNMGAWCSVDEYLRDQLETLRRVHRDLGFEAFQKLVALWSFDADFYNANKSRLLGAQGAWGELNGRFAAHSRLIDACLGFDSRERLPSIRCPTLIVHAGRDQVTGPRLTRPIEAGIPGAVRVMMEDAAHVIVGREQKQRFCEILLAFLNAN